MKKVSRIVNFAALGVMIGLLILQILLRLEVVTLQQYVFQTVLVLLIMLMASAVIFIFNYVIYKIAKSKFEDVKEYKLIYFNLAYALILILGYIFMN